MQILKIVVGIILLGGAAWAIVRSYRGGGKSSWAILLFAIFLLTLGSYFLVDTIAAYVREFRVGPEWMR